MIRAVRQLIWTAGTLVAVGAAAEPLTMSRAIALALEHDLEVRTATAEVGGAQAELAGASRWVNANPRLSGSAGSRATERGNALDFGIEVEQPIEIGGQRGARVAAAEAQVAAAKAELARRRAEVAARTVELFAGVLAAEARLKAAEDGLVFARRSVDVVRDRLQAGDASRLDVNASLVELGRSQGEVLTARRDLLNRRAELAFALALDPTVELHLAPELEAVVAGMAGGPPAVADATTTALNQRADLQAARASVAAAKARSSVAIRTAVPTPAVGVGYQREGDERVIQGLLAVDLPLFDRNQAERGVAAARVTQAQSRLDVLERRIPREVQSAVGRLEAAQAAVRVFQEGTNEAAEQSVTLVQEGYRAGKLDLPQLLLIQRGALESKRGYIDALEELAAAWAQLQGVLGRGAIDGSGLP